MRIIAIWAFVNASVAMWADLLGCGDRGIGAFVFLTVIGALSAMADDGIRRRR